MSTELLPNTIVLACGMNEKLFRKQLFPTIFLGVSSIHEARIWNLFSISNKKREQRARNVPLASADVRGGGRLREEDCVRSPKVHLTMQAKAMNYSSVLFKNIRRCIT